MQIWFEALSRLHTHTAVFPQAVVKFWHVVFTPGGNGGGGGGGEGLFFFFFFFFASAEAIRPSEASAPAASPPRPRRVNREFTLCVNRSNCSPSTLELSLPYTSWTDLAGGVDAYTCDVI